MTDEQILQKAIDKAVKNDWKEKNKYNHLYQMMELYPVKFFEKNEYFAIIFSHDFAKAFWGKEKVLMQSVMEAVHGIVTPMPAWKYHLIVMVQQEEPLKYLEQFL